MIDAKAERRPLDTNGAPIRTNYPASSVPAQTPVRRATLRQVLANCALWPHQQRIILTIAPGALLNGDLDRLRTARPDLVIRAESPCELTKRRWQIAINSSEFHAAHAEVMPHAATQ